MPWTGWFGLALGIAMVTASKLGPPPVILDLGPHVPTPAPTAKLAAKKRLITIITVQNTPAGESVISFEATDFADEGDGKTHTIASKSYSLAEEKPELKEGRDKIVQHLRAFERDLLDYAERAGPPKERAPLTAPQQQPGKR